VCRAVVVSVPPYSIYMTPLERSRFAADSANAESPSRLDSARQWIDSARQNVMTHHGWTTGLGDCCSDCTSCCSVIVCAPTVVGQLTEKMWPSSSSIGPFKFTCLIVAAILWTGALGSLMVHYYSPPCSGKDMDEDGDYDTLDYAACDGIYYNSGKYAIASFLAGIFGCGMCVLTTLVRSYIRKRDNIPVTGECRAPPHVRMRRNGPLLSPFVSFVRDALLSSLQSARGSTMWRAQSAACPASSASSCGMRA
jgi:Cys-rich protein (TIGR01571 family)